MCTKKFALFREIYAIILITSLREKKFPLENVLMISGLS